MRYILGIDTASPEGSVALAGDGRTLGLELLHPGEHSSGLATAVARLLEGRGIGLDRLLGIAVSEGPGSFTGLRIGLAWAKGVALGRGIPLALVSAHEAAARAHRGRAPRIATLVPAERGRVDAALWNGAAGVALLWGPERLDEEDALDRFAQDPGVEDAGAETMVTAVALAPSTPRLAASLRDHLGDETIVILDPIPLADAVAEIGDQLLLAGAAVDPVTASPSYGRDPNARKPAL